MRVLFWGNFIPLQGVEYIVRAAKLLESRTDIDFVIIGSGQDSSVIEELSRALELKNIEFVERMPVRELPAHIRKADICLGIFGDTDKAGRVIPNKAYEAIAMRKPLISGDTPAIHELFTDRENILLCNMADPEDLARKIGELAGDEHLRENISRGGYALYQKHLTPKSVVEPLVSLVSKL